MKPMPYASRPENDPASVAAETGRLIRVVSRSAEHDCPLSGASLTEQGDPAMKTIAGVPESKKKHNTREKAGPSSDSVSARRM